MRMETKSLAREGRGLCASALRRVAILVLFPCLVLSQARDLSGRRPPLRTVQDIFRLSKTEAAKAYPIELEAVVTYSDPEWGILFVQDQTGTTFIDVHGSSAKYPKGARVRVDGVSAAGNNGPAIAQTRILVLGRGVLPSPEQRSVAELDTGAAESHLVVTEGVLRPCYINWLRVCFRVFDGKKLVWLAVPERDSVAAQSLIGATVKVKGVVGQHVNDATKKREAAQLFVDSLEDIKVETPPLPQSFFSSPIPIEDLRPTDADQRFVRQIHVRGIVTWQSPGLFSIQDNSGMLFVGTRKTEIVQTGSTVDAIGFPGHGTFGLELSDSAVRLAAVQSNAGATAPLQLTAAEVVKRSLNGRRVHLRARLISQSANETEFVYELQDGGQRFNAVLLRSDVTRETVGLQRDSVLELTGVALIQSGTPEWPESLLILIDSPADMVVQGGFGWLTLRRGLAILGGMGFCVVAPLVWVTLLRRTVRKQTATIRARLENELQLETKYRRLFERNLAAVYAWRPDGTIVDCNMAFVGLLGFHSHRDLIGRSYWDFQADPADCELLCAALQERALSNRDVSLRRNDGVTVHLLTNITPVSTAEGTVYETTAIDVTQLRQNQAELQRAKDEAVYESLNDVLTGLPNRKLFNERLALTLANARRDACIVALLYLDLDGFKAVNDSLGHSIGDVLLVLVADRLRSRVSKTGFLARLAGDEFVVILSDLNARDEAALVAESLRETLFNPFSVEGHELTINVSIGISMFPENASDAAELLKQADSAMYAAKREGKNRVMCFAPEIGFLVHERLSMKNQLKDAVAGGEISVHYQPEFKVNGGRLIRFEALARWTHPNLGEIPPSRFIPIAEESGLISFLGAHIMHQACTEAVRWQSIVPYPIQVAVNVSSIQFLRKDFVEEVSSILLQTGLPNELLQIEITESALLTGHGDAVEIMNRFHAMGVSLAIDNFGVGYSSLSYLPFLPFDALKIDRSFVSNLNSQTDMNSRIRTFIMLARNVGKRVIAEGVETSAQLQLIRAFGAEDVQGFLLGRPTPNPIDVFLIPPKDSAGVL
jgi:diguanylate cyclase (GGDEF)-like protein/PAS domain S-box-containing protein